MSDDQVWPEGVRKITQADIDKVPTVYADGFLGIANTNNITKIVFYDMVFNPEPGAKMPQPRAVFTLAIPERVLGIMAQEIVNQISSAKAAEGSDGTA